MQVVIVGGGVGGLVAALAFAARGVRPVLLEREAAFAEAGAGVQLGPNAVRVLDALGLGRALRAASCAPEAAEVFSGADGALRLRLPLGAAAQARWGAPYLQLHRADLQRLLLDAIAARDAADLRLGSAVAHAQGDGGVRLASGEELRGEIVIGADGLRSRVRGAVLGEAAPHYTGQTAWRALIPTDSLPEDCIPTGASVWGGRGRHVVAYRVQGGRAVNLVAIVEARGWRGEGWREAGDPSVLAGLFAGWPHPVPTLCAAPAGLGLPTWRWALFDRPPSRSWRRGRAVLVGDAAHPMLPFLAQGAAMAIEDAAVLAARLTAVGDPEKALDAYAAARAPRVARVQAWSTRNARLFHLPQPAAKLVFAAARTLDARDPTDGMSRFDWLYGWRDDAA